MKKTKIILWLVTAVLAAQASASAPPQLAAEISALYFHATSRINARAAQISELQRQIGVLQGELEVAKEKGRLWCAAHNSQFAEQQLAGGLQGEVIPTCEAKPEKSGAQ